MSQFNLSHIKRTSNMAVCFGNDVISPHVLAQEYVRDNRD